MTPIGPSGLSGPELLGLPDITVDPLALRDVEAFLLGLLPNEHALGGPVRPGPVGSSAVLASGQAQLRAGGILIRDDEHTPIAALTEIVPNGEHAVLGRLVPVRRRESGHRAELALDRAELPGGPATESTALLVFDRPPTTADGGAIDEAVASGSVWVVVPDSPDGDLPLGVLVATAEAWLSDLGAVASTSVPGAHTLPSGAVIRLRTAPLAWRDPTSDGALVTRLAAALGATRTTWLRSSDGSAGSGQWQSALASLREGRVSSLDGVSEDIERILLRWKPARPRGGLTVMFTGLSGSGKSTVARGVAQWLENHTDRSVTLLDGDVVRQMLSSGLGFDRAGRVANVRRIGYVAAEVSRHGGVAICAPIAPYAETRSEVRAMVEAVGDFLLVHVNTPIEVCEGRDLKGLYARARAGTLPEFTGVSDPYEEPRDAVVRIDTSVVGNDEAVSVVVSLLRDGGWLEGREA